MSILRKTVFGRKKTGNVGNPNIFIGNGGTEIPDKATLLSKAIAGIVEEDILYFNIDENNNVEVRIEKSYQLRYNAFHTSEIIFFEDVDNLCFHLGGFAFFRANVLWVKLEGVTSGDTSVFRETKNLSYVYLPSLISLSGNYFLDDSNVVIGDFPNLTTLTNIPFYNDLSSTKSQRILSVPKINPMGATTGYDQVFRYTGQYLEKLYVHPDLQTNNGGLPDGDITYCTDSGATAIYVNNSTAPSAINDLTLNGNIVNFTVPNSVNGIDFYEVFANNVYVGQISGPGETLEISNGDVVYLFARDIYYNKSKSNQATATGIDNHNGNYLFDGTSGAVINTKGQDATAINVTRGQAGIDSGSSFYFNGVDSYVELSDNFKKCFADVNNRFAFSLFFKWEGPNTGGDDGIIIGYGGGTGTAANFAAFVTQTGELKTVIRGTYTSLGNIISGQWYYLGVSWNRYNAIANFDGQSISLNVGPTVIQDYSPRGVILGTRVSAQDMLWFKGHIDNLDTFIEGKTFQEFEALRN